MQRIVVLMCLLGILIGCGIDQQATFPPVAFLDSQAVTPTIHRFHHQEPSGESQNITPDQPKVGDAVMMHPLWDPEKPQPLPNPTHVDYNTMNLVQDARNNPTFKSTTHFTILGAFNIRPWLPKTSSYRSILVTELHGDDGTSNFAAFVEDQSHSVTTITTMEYQFPGLKAQTLIADIDDSLFMIGRIDEQLKPETATIVVDRFIDQAYPHEPRVKASFVHDGFFVIPITFQEREAWTYLTYIRLMGQNADHPIHSISFHGPFAYSEGITSIR